MENQGIDSHSLESFQDRAIAAAQEAGSLLRERHGSSFAIAKKGRINLVTEMDLASEELIVRRLLTAYPDHQILAEERGQSQSSSPWKWVIDPLDGTTNYAHGYRFFCVSIGLEFQGKIVLGVVHDPITLETFSAISGAGAELNGQPIRVSIEATLENAMLSTGFSYQPEAVEQNLELFNALIRQARAIRRDGSAALDLCYVACGRFDGFWELSLSAWDVAAGTLIVREAGGGVSRFDGAPGTIYDGEIVVSNGSLHAALLESIGAVRAQR